MTKYRVEGVLELTRFRRGNTGGDTSPFDGQVIASADDGWSSDAPDFQPTSTRTFIGKPAAIYDAWHRILNVTIPQGVTVSDAYFIYFVASGIPDGAGVKTNIYMDDIDDAVAPTTQGEHAALNRTTNFTAWDDADLSGGPVNSPSFVSAVQEILDRGSWASGNAMQILHDDDGSTAGKYYDLKSYDNNPVAAVQLHVEWST